MFALRMLFTLFTAIFMVILSVGIRLFIDENVAFATAFYVVASFLLSSVIWYAAEIARER